VTVAALILRRRDWGIIAVAACRFPEPQPPRLRAGLGFGAGSVPVPAARHRPARNPFRRRLGDRRRLDLAATRFQQPPASPRGHRFGFGSSPQRRGGSSRPRPARAPFLFQDRFGGQRRVDLAPARLAHLRGIAVPVTSAISFQRCRRDTLREFGRVAKAVHPGGHHHHNDDTDDVPETESAPVQKTDFSSDHDLTAVFIAAVDSVPGERSQTGDHGLNLIHWIGEFMPSIAVGKLSSAETTIMGHPPPKACCDCPRYVQQLTLLI